MKISYEEFKNKTSFSHEDLLAHAWGNLVENPPQDGFSMLPAPPMLMFDEITEVSHRGNKGRIVAQQHIAIDDWFFQCHFRGDPVQPGCLGVDAVWQLIGFYITLRGAPGSGRALGCKEVEFLGQIRPHNKIVRYEIDIRRYTEMQSQGTAIAIGTARVLVDDELIYNINQAKVGVFKGNQYQDYPYCGPNHLGGQIQRDEGDL